MSFSASMKPFGIGGVVSSSISCGEIVERVDAERETDARHRAEQIGRDRHRMPGRLLEQQRRSAAGDFDTRSMTRGDLEVRAQRLGDARELLAAVELGDEGRDVGEHDGVS